jgi:hypothetical protein
MTSHSDLWILLVILPLFAAFAQPIVFIWLDMRRRRRHGKEQ